MQFVNDTILRVIAGLHGLQGRTDDLQARTQDMQARAKSEDGQTLAEYGLIMAVTGSVARRASGSGSQRRRKALRTRVAPRSTSRPGDRADRHDGRGRKSGSG